MNIPPKLKVGDYVKITDKTNTGFYGIIEEVPKNLKYIVVYTDMYNRCSIFFEDISRIYIYKSDSKKLLIRLTI